MIYLITTQIILKMKKVNINDVNSNYFNSAFNLNLCMRSLIDMIQVRVHFIQIMV